MTAQCTAVIQIKQHGCLLGSVCFTLPELVFPCLGRNNRYKCGTCSNVALKSEDEIRAEEDSDALT